MIAQQEESAVYTEQCRLCMHPAPDRSPERIDGSLHTAVRLRYSAYTFVHFSLHRIVLCKGFARACGEGKGRGKGLLW